MSANRTRLAVRVTSTQPSAADSATNLGAGHMALKSRFAGRMERRLSIAIVVQLAHAEGPPANGAELTYTDNVSARGARVVSSREWKTGEVARVTALKDEITIRGKVVYCQKLSDNRYCVGLNFNGHGVTWSGYKAYSRT
jgi:hypothetical protein